VKAVKLLRIHPDGLIVDAFAGGGGASLGIEWALGRGPDVAINHDRQALAMHARNHPLTEHRVGDIWHTRPEDVVRGRPLTLLWGSPDCTFHSKARGSAPFRDPRGANKRRALAGVLLRWAKTARPDWLFVENVEEFQAWGPLGHDGKPDPAKAGRSFRVWVGKLRALGYTVEWRQLRACDYGAPTTRRRLFIIATSTGQPIVWPEPTHGPGRAHPYRTAAECIDWSIPCPSIFERPRPLADKTLARIARGVRRFVLKSARPFIVKYYGTGGPRDLDAPLDTIVTRDRFALVAPVLYHSGNGERPGQAPRVYDIQQPLGTVMAEGVKHALSVAFLAKHYGGKRNDKVAGVPLDKPAGTITTVDHHALVAAHLVHLRGSDRGGRSVEAPAPTITAGGTHIAAVYSLLQRFEGYDAAAELATVTIDGETYVVVDIGMRMLSPRELFRCQGFPDSYVIDEGADGAPLTKTEQVRMVGNSVSPVMAEALVKANFARTVRATKQLTLRVG
jgi:DNA (cytosine-5)-methyltransferase 1